VGTAVVVGWFVFSAEAWVGGVSCCVLWRWWAFPLGGGNAVVVGWFSFATGAMVVVPYSGAILGCGACCGLVGGCLGHGSVIDLLVCAVGSFGCCVPWCARWARCVSRCGCSMLQCAGDGRSSSLTVAGGSRAVVVVIVVVDHGAALMVVGVVVGGIVVVAAARVLDTGFSFSDISLTAARSVVAAIVVLWAALMVVVVSMGLMVVVVSVGGVVVVAVARVHVVDTGFSFVD
jgi:hypothetical protein